MAKKREKGRWIERKTPFFEKILKKALTFRYAAM